MQDYGIVVSVDREIALPWTTKIAYEMLDVQYPSIGTYMQLIGPIEDANRVSFDCNCVLEKISRNSGHRLSMKPIVTNKASCLSHATCLRGLLCSPIIAHYTSWSRGW